MNLRVSAVNLRVSAVLLGMSIAACDSGTGPDSNVRFSLSSCLKKAEKRSAGEAEGEIGRMVFRSSDSLAFSLSMELLCEASYSMIASVASPETLSVEVVDVGDSRSRCTCLKEVAFEYESPASDLGKIAFVKTGALVYPLQ
jgi:hypothetical protein